LKLEAPDGKMRETDTTNTETLFRIIQSIPSPKAKPFKKWLAQVGYERIQEIEDPELATQRTRALEKKSGRKVVSKDRFDGTGTWLLGWSIRLNSKRLASEC